MGRRGPIPKPTALKKLQGTFQPCRANANEPVLDVARPDPLHGLDQMELRHFDRLADEVIRLGTVSDVDGGALSSLAVAECRMIRGARQVAKARSGVASARQRMSAAETSDELKDAAKLLRLSEGSLGFWLKETHAAQQLDRQLRQEFGLTPSSRTRVGGKPATAKPDPDSRASLLFGGGGRGA